MYARSSLVSGSATTTATVGRGDVTFRTDVPHGPCPKDVDREVFAVFSAMNETQSPLLSASLHRFAKRRPYPRDRNNDEFTESNLMHSINGYVFGNEPMIADVGESRQPRGLSSAAP